MTVTSTLREVSYPGAGLTGPFAFSWLIWAKTDLRVYRNNTLLTHITDYTVPDSSLANPNGGTITLTSPLAVGQTLWIELRLPLVQSTDLKNQGDYQPQTLESQLDRQVRIDQQQAADIADLQTQIDDIEVGAGQLTADELAAIEGTSGTPNAANKFVTNSDTRLSGGAGSVLSLFGTYEATANGLVGDGVADDRAALNTLANTTITAAGGTIVFKANRTYRIAAGADVTIPANRTLVFERNAKLSRDVDGAVVTILGEIVAGNHAIFAGATVGIRFATVAEAGNVPRPRTTAAKPEWWGAAGDNATDDFIPIQRMLDAVAGYPFYSLADSDIYTATGGTNTTVTVAGAGWCPNQWQGSTLAIDSGTGSGSTYFRIASNTATVITVDGYYTGAENAWSFNAGNFTNGAGAPAAGSVIIISQAAAATRLARMPIDWSGWYYSSKPLRRINVSAMMERGRGRDITNIRVGGGESGTATGGSVTTLVKASATWTPNQWRKFWVVLLTGTGAGGYARIVSNTETTLTAIANSSFGAADGTTTFAIIPECVMDFNGCFMPTLEDMTLTCETAAGMSRGTMFGLGYWRRSNETFRGSSNGTFTNVWINGHWFWSAWQFGGGIGGIYSPWQEDLPQFFNIRADGSWHFAYTGLYYKFAYFFGSAIYGNNLNHLGEGIHAAATESVIGIDRTNVYLNGVTSGPCRYGVYVQNGVSGYVEIGAWRAETISRILHCPTPTTACSVTIRSMTIPDWVPLYDAALDCTPLVYWTGPGGVKIDGFNLGTGASYAAAWIANGQATSGTTTTVTASGAAWPVDIYKGFYFRIRSGTGKFQPWVKITGNTLTTITFTPALSVAPDATTFFDVFAIPVFIQEGPGTMQLDRISVGGLDMARSFRAAVIGSQIIVTDVVVQDPMIGGLTLRYVPGPVTILPHSETPSTAWMVTQHAYGKSGGYKPDVFTGRIGDGVFGISRLASPVVTVPAIGVTDSVLADKTGAHSGGATTRNYKIVAKVPGPGGTFRRALASATITVTNTLATFDEFNYVRLYPPYTPADPAWVFDVLKDTGGGTYAVFVNGENLTADELYTFDDRGQATKAYTLPTVDETGRLEVGGAFVENIETLTYGTTITPNMNAGQFKRIVVTNNSAFTIANPTAASVGQRLTISILNSSGGAMGAITWGSEFEMAGIFTNPANGTRRTISFIRETATEWVEQARNPSDVA